MNPNFTKLPIEIINDEILSYLDIDTKMKLKYREIEKYDNIRKELSHIDINKFNRLYNIYYRRLKSYEKVIVSKILREYDNNIDFLLIYYIEKVFNLITSEDFTNMFYLIDNTMDTFKRYAYFDIDYKNNSYFLKFKTVKDLKQLCKINNITLYSKLRKNELIKLLLSI
jgi:hypothetical protein